MYELTDPIGAKFRVTQNIKATWGGDIIPESGWYFNGFSKNAYSSTIYTISFQKGDHKTSKQGQ